MLLDVLCTLHCSPDCIYLLSFFFKLIFLANRRPHHYHCVADKLDYITTILVQIVHHAVHVAIYGQGDLLVTLHSFLGAAFRELCES